MFFTPRRCAFSWRHNYLLIEWAKAKNKLKGKGIFFLSDPPPAQDLLLERCLGSVATRMVGLASLFGFTDQVES